MVAAPHPARRGTGLEEVTAFVEEHTDLIARILRSGSPEAQAMALALLANVDAPGPLEEVRRQLDRLIHEARSRS